jgi:hypothetical protein
VENTNLNYNCEIFIGQNGSLGIIFVVFCQGQECRSYPKAAVHEAECSVLAIFSQRSNHQV